MSENLAVGVTSIGEINCITNAANWVWDYPSVLTTKIIISGEEKKEDKDMIDMIGLYLVYAVNKKAKTIAKKEVIAKDEAEAKIILARSINVDEFPDDNTEYFASLIGTWKDEKPKEVKIIQ